MKRHPYLSLCLVSIAILARIVMVFVLQSHRVPRATYEHGEIAANLLAGRGFSIRFLGAEGPTSQQAPVYPALVALAYAIEGVETPRSLLLLEVGQSILGGVMVLGVMALAGQITGGRPLTSGIAGALAAVHPALVYAATHVQVALLGATLLVWTLYCAYRTGASRKALDALLTGGLLAILALTDPILALGSVGVIWAIALGGAAHSQGQLRTVQLGAICLFTAAVGVLPWIIRNAVVHGEFVPIKSTFGYAFWQGNCALSQGTDKVVRPSVERVLASTEPGEGLAGLNRRLWAARHEAGYIDDIALSREDRQLLGAVSEPERSRILMRRTVAELRAMPERYFSLCLRRLMYFWLFDETNPKTRVLTYRATHLGLTVLAAAGLLLAPWSVRRRLAPTLATAFLIALFHTLTIVSARFHIPIEPLLAVWAGAGISRWERERDPERSAPPRHHIIGVRLERRLERGKLVR